MIKRKQKLTKSGLQLRLTLVFVTLSCMSALFQVFLINRSMLELARTHGQSGDPMLAALPSILGQNLVITLLVLVPLMLVVGVLVTHRVAGPVYRFERYFQALLRGEDPGPIHLRRRDELHELAGLVNEVREQRLNEQTPSSTTDTERRAA